MKSVRLGAGVAVWLVAMATGMGAAAALPPDSSNERILPVVHAVDNSGKILEDVEIPLQGQLCVLLPNNPNWDCSGLDRYGAKLNADWNFVPTTFSQMTGYYQPGTQGGSDLHAWVLTAGADPAGYVLTSPRTVKLVQACGAVRFGDYQTKVSGLADYCDDSRFPQVPIQAWTGAFGDDSITTEHPSVFFTYQLIQDVVPVNPTVTQSVCQDGKPTVPAVTLPNTEGISYRKSGEEKAGGKVTVTATLTSKVWKWGALPTGWTQTGDNTAEHVVDLTEPVCAPPATPKTTPSKLASTGTVSLASASWLGAALLGMGALIASRMRRQR